MLIGYVVALLVPFWPLIPWNQKNAPADSIENTFLAVLRHLSYYVIPNVIINVAESDAVYNCSYTRARGSYLENIQRSWRQLACARLFARSWARTDPCSWAFNRHRKSCNVSACECELDRKQVSLLTSITVLWPNGYYDRLQIPDL